MRILLTGCHVVEPANGEIMKDAALLVDDGLIAWVGPADSYPGESAVDCEIQMDGHYVMPGLWDMHVHLAMTVLKETADEQTVPSETLFSYRRALAFLNSGVTSLRLVGSSPDGVDFAIRNGIQRGDYPGPRILTAGEGIASTGGHGYRGGEGCDGPYEFRKATRKRLWQGADLIKVMVTGGMGGRYETFDAPQTLRDEVAAAVQVAHNAGKHVAGHIASPSGAIMCSEEGVDTVEHGYALDEASLQVMEQNATAFVPTAVVTHDPDYWHQLEVASWAMEKIRRARDSHRRAVALALNSSIEVAVGTDLPTAFMDGTVVTVKEMEIMVELGASEREALRAATVVPAAICGLDKKIGQLKPGYRADIIATAGNPFSSISSLREVDLVIRDGAVVKNDISGHKPVGLPQQFLTGPC